MITLPVRASGAYDVLIGTGLLCEIGSRIAALTGPCAAAVVSDDTVFSLYGQTVCESLERAGFRVVSFVFPHGEESKSLATYGEILNFLAESRLTRSDVLVALGGGVVGDLGGFAASTYLRGIRFVQVPTTLLAAVDSSVGGKTAVDLPVGKNLVGSFCQPALVLCDEETLSTLPEAVYRDGCAEVIKYGVLGNAAFFEALRETPAKKQLEHVIATCVAMKRDVVCEDEFDHGRRQLLNLGHTFGHAVEACSGFSVSHGSAVAIGMAMIARAARNKGFCGEETLSGILSLLRQYGLPTETEYLADALLSAACSDKKISGDTIRLIVPDAIGRCHAETVRISELLDWLKAGGAL